MRALTILALGLALAMLPSASVVVLAGPLNGHPDAYNGWTGSTDFDDDGDASALEGDGLEGSVDWAVFTKAAFDSAFPDSGYSPPAGELAYTYQVNVAGTAAVSNLSVGLNDPPAGTIGYFDINNAAVAPTATSLGAFSANYSFVGNTIPVGMVSTGLAYSSPNVPFDFFGSVIDSGSSAFVIPLPSPSPFPIPEPGTLVLAALAGALVICGRSLRTTT